MSSAVLDVSIFAALVAGLIGALELGYWLGRRAGSERDAEATSQVGAIQGALLGLLGLLLAFSFAGAGGRFVERQDLILREANAIGTAYLRADLLDVPARTELRSALREYTEHRLRATASLRGGWDPTVLSEVERLHHRIWRAAIDGVAARSGTAIAVLPPVNEVFDLHATRVSAGLKRTPTLVLVLLIACSVLAVAVIGYGCGLSGALRAPITISLALLVGIALWITIDLDQPRAGLIRLDDAPLEALRFDET